MTKTSYPTGTQTNNVIVWIGGGLACFMLLSTALIAGNLLLHGSLIRAEAEAQLARAIDQENMAFCSRFGVGPQTLRFTECADALRAVRAREIERRTDSFI